MMDVSDHMEGCCHCLDGHLMNRDCVRDEVMESKQDLGAIDEEHFTPRGGEFENGRHSLQSSCFKYTHGDITHAVKTLS